MAKKKKKKAVNGHLGSFHFLATVNKQCCEHGCANTCSGPYFQFFGGLYPEVKLLDHIVILWGVDLGRSMLSAWLREVREGLQEGSGKGFFYL